jgi:osmoprotectant transport system ATP-binding protein
VDPIVRRELQAELRRLQTELGKTILLVTHDVDEAFALADQIVVLRAGGQVAQIAAPTDLLLHPVDAFVASFIGSGGAERSLEVRDVDGAAVVVDRDGRLLGRLGP